MRVDECAGEDLLLEALRCGHWVYGLAEEELGCTVEGETEEEGLKVDRGAITGYLIDKFLNVDFEGIQVLDLSFREVRSYERLSKMKSAKFCIQEGLKSTCECSQCAPSVVKMPLPSSGPKVCWPSPKSSKSIVRTALMFSGSMVLMKTRSITVAD